MIGSNQERGQGLPGVHTYPSQNVKPGLVSWCHDKGTCESLAISVQLQIPKWKWIVNSMKLFSDHYMCIVACTTTHTHHKHSHTHTPHK